MIENVPLLKPLNLLRHPPGKAAGPVGDFPPRAGNARHLSSVREKICLTLFVYVFRRNHLMFQRVSASQPRPQQSTEKETYP